jgi:hypothetical protein
LFVGELAMAVAGHPRAGEIGEDPLVAC